LNQIKIFLKSYYRIFKELSIIQNTGYL